MNLNHLKTVFGSLILAAVVVACGGGASKESTAEGTSSTAPAGGESATFAVDAGASVVAWKGEVAGVYGHNGVITVSEGTITAAGDQITGGEVIIDMTSIAPTDSASYKDEDGSRASDLVAHLSTGDFFLVEEFPTASFVIKSHTDNQLVGDLTIRGTTSEETVELSSLEISPEGVKGEGTLVFDRQKYGVSWEHFVKDYILSDDIEIKLNIVAAK